MFKRILSLLRKKSPKGVEHLRFGWEIEDSNMFLISLFDMISAKCQHGDNMNALNDHERIFFVVQTLETEVNNGGFEQFFSNSSGDFANELVSAFTQIGASHAAEICQKALSVFQGKVPRDRTERLAQMSSVRNYYRFLDECDDAFFNMPENLNELNYAYVHQHRQYFPEGNEV